MSKVIFLDLDGTLTDAGPGIKNCFNYALERMGLPEIRKNNDWIVGPPLWDSFAKVGVTDDQLNHAVICTVNGIVISGTLKTHCMMVSLIN